MTQENKARLIELGWIPVGDKFPPIGVDINVCQATDNTQILWSQTFKSEKEIKDAKITHWGKRILI